MKRFLTVLFLTAFAAIPVFAQDFLFSGEMKSGFYWERSQEEKNEPREYVKLHNNDDAGGQQGRFRLNMQFSRGNVGAKIRFELSSWTKSDNEAVEFIIFETIYPSQIF